MTTLAWRDPLSDRFLIDHALSTFAATSPDATALVADGRRLTYRELDTLANQCAALFHEAGAKRGDRVIAALDNSIEAVVAFYGALRADCVPSLLAPTMRPRRLGQVMQLAEPSVFVAARSMHDGLASLEDLPDHARPKAIYLVGQAGQQLPEGVAQSLDFMQAVENVSGAPPARGSIELDLATICWTSGSTGESKGVMLTHQNMRNSATAIGAYLDHTARDIILCVLPISHTYGLFQLIVTHAFGGTLVLEKGFSMMWPLVQKLAEEKVTGFAGVPTIFASILGLKNIAKVDLSSLRYMTNAAYGLPGPQLVRLKELLPQVKFFAMYGQTECTRVCYLPPSMALERPASVGIAMPNEELWIEREDGSKAAPGEVGELVVRGPNVMRGYWKNPEATERALRPGPIPGEVVLHTADLFKMDEDRYLYFVARKDDIIKTRGEKVSPLEVESVVCKIAGVIEAAAVGVPDTALGVAVKVAVVKAKDVDVKIDEIKKNVRNELGEVAVPKYVEFVDALPKTSSGKVKKSELI